MTPKQRRLKNFQKSRIIVKIKKIIFGIIFISAAIFSLAILLRSLND
jgi:hypothetical protein